MRSASASALADLALTFATGALAGGLLMGGIVALDLSAGRALLDIGGDGIGLRDTAAVAWIFGQLALLARFLLPALNRL